MFKILVTGSNGQVGSEIKVLSAQYNQYAFTFVDRSHLDFSQLDSIKKYFVDKSFDFIINCAGYTAVDKAETESVLAETINHHAVAELAQIAKEKRISLIHLSTDYVFSGKSFCPYVEDDLSGPMNTYGKTKVLGEEAIKKISPEKALIIRTSWVYSSFGNNFLKTMLRLGNEKDSLGVIFDQVGTPTYARDLARMILEILPKIQNKVPEVYHFSNEGVASWYDFAKAIFELADIECTVKPIAAVEYPLPAARPYYSLLNKSKIKNKFEIIIPYWKDSLKECLLSHKSF